MEPTETNTVVATENKSVVEPENRKWVLVLIGIPQILFGGLLILAGLMAMINLPMGADQGGNHQVMSMIMAMIMNLGTGSLLITLGLGLAKARKWAHAILTIMSAFTFCIGIFGFLFLMIYGTKVFEGMPMHPEFNKEMLGSLVKVMLVFDFVIGIILPLLVYLACINKNMIAMIQRLNPQKSWVDKAPLPIIALSGLTIYGGIALPINMVAGYSVPLMGFWLEDIPASLFMLVYAGILVYVGYQLFKMKLKAWYGITALYAFSIVSFILTVKTAGLEGLYGTGSMSSQQIELFKQSFFFNDDRVVGLVIVIMVPYIAFIAYAKKHFKKSELVES